MHSQFEMRRYYPDPATFLVNFGVAVQWKTREEIAGIEGAADAGSSAQQDIKSDQARGRLIRRGAGGAAHIQQQLMSRECAEAGSATRANSSYSAHGGDDHDFENDEERHEEGINETNRPGGMLLKCMCSSVLLLGSITVLLLVLPLLLPAPLPPPPLELLLLPLLILLLLMCLALSPPSSASSNR